MDPSRFKHPIDSEFLCLRCGNVLIQPSRSSNCDHEYCHRCIAGAAASRSGNGGQAATSLDTASVTRNAASASPDDTGDETALRHCIEEGCGALVEHIRLSQKTARLVEKLEISCDNASEGCEWVGPWAKLEEHRTNHCDFEVVRCPWHAAGCPEQLHRHLVPGHKASCIHRSDQCEHCLKLFKHCDIPLHHSRCLLMPVTCSMCSAPMNREQVQSHLATDCPEVIVPCPLATYGCTLQLRRCEMASHVQERCEHHLNLLVDELDKERQRNDALLDTITSTIKNQDRMLKEVSTFEGQPVGEVVSGLRSQVETLTGVVDRFLRGTVITVDPRGSGNFSTVAQALEIAAEGDTIILRPGVYNESVTISKAGIWLRGSGQGEASIEPSEGSAVCIKAQGVKVSHLIIRGTCKVSNAVRVDVVSGSVSSSSLVNTASSASTTASSAGGAVCIEDCDILDARMAGIVVSKGQCHIRSCRIANSKQCGIEWRSTDAGSTIDRCFVEQSSKPNIVVQGANAKVHIQNSVIRKGEQNGVWIKAGATCTITDTEVSENAFSNVDVVGQGSSCAINNSSLTHSQKCGLCVAEGATASLDRSTLHSNAFPNIAILASSSLENMSHTKCHNSERQGVVIKSGARARFGEGNAVTRNQDTNVSIEPGATVEGL